MWQLFKSTYDRWNKDDAGMMAAAVAYYVALSFLPTLLLMASGLGLFLKWTNTGHEAHDYLLTVVRQRADASLADSINHALTDIEELAIYGGPLGAFTLLLASLAIFAQLDRAFDRIYRVQKPVTSGMFSPLISVLKYRLRAFAMLLGLGCVVIFIFSAGLAFSWFQGHATSYLPSTLTIWSIVEACIEVGLNSCVFAAVYHWVPRIPVRWKHAFVGGVAAAIVWEVGRQLLGTFVIGQRHTSAYGLIGALTGMMLWGYCGIAVLLAGAELAQTVAEQAGAHLAPPQQRPSAPRKSPGNGWNTAFRAFDIVFGICLLYVSSFFILRTTQTHELGAQMGEADAVTAVIFSSNPTLQDTAVTIYRPLIEILPPDRLYPSGSELASLSLEQQHTL